MKIDKVYNTQIRYQNEQVNKGYKQLFAHDSDDIFF